MPRTSTQRPPKYRRHKPTGRAYVALNGREYYLGKYGSVVSRQAYDCLIAKWIQGGGRYRPTPQQEISVVEVMVAYIAHAKRYYRKGGKPTRECGHAIEICRAIRPLYGKSLAAEFGPLALKTVRQTLVDAGIARKHVNKQTDRIKRMFRWAAAEELIPASIPQSLSMVSGLRAGRTEAHETAPVPPVEDPIIDATVKHLPAVAADMVRFQRLTGCRPEEVCNLRPCDLDRSEVVWAYKPATHKTEHHGRQRSIFVGPKAQEVLLRYLARDTQAYCFRPCDSEEKRRAAATAARITPPNCGNSPGTNRKRKANRSAGEKYSTDSYRRAIHRACDKAFPAPKGATGDDLKTWQSEHRWSPNQLRHAAATEVRRQFGLEAAQVILGHSQANVTQVYAERDFAKGVEVARQIG